MEVFVLASRRIHTAFLQPRQYGCCVGRAAAASFHSDRILQGPSKRTQYQGYDTFLATQQQGNQLDKASKKPSRVKQSKKKKSQKKSKQLFRAERVLANRSGKTRAECHKLLTRYAVSILEEDDNSNNHDGSVDQSKLRIISSKEQIPMTARIFINKKFEVPSSPPLLMVYNKPKWVLSTMGSDAKERRNLQNLKFAWSSHMHPVGRLDYDTSGLLLFSSSGKLTQKLLHPKFEKEKEYIAVVTGIVQEEKLRERLQDGVELADVQSRRTKTNIPREETFTTRAELLDVQHWSRKDVAPYLQKIRDTLPNEYNVTDLNLRGYMEQLDAQELSAIRLVVHEGKHRMVRRMLATCGHPVVSLKRERIGVIELGELPEGKLRNITDAEREWAQSVLDSK